MKAEKQKRKKVLFPRRYRTDTIEAFEIFRRKYIGSVQDISKDEFADLAMSRGLKEISKEHSLTA